LTIFFRFVIVISAASNPQRPGSALSAAKQESEEHRRLLQTIQQQTEQIGSLISTVNSQVKISMWKKKKKF
jgi:hypothetical protein